MEKDGLNIFSNQKMGRFSSGETHSEFLGEHLPKESQRAILLDSTKARESTEVGRRCLVFPGILFFHLLQQVGLVLKAHPDRVKSQK